MVISRGVAGNERRAACQAIAATSWVYVGLRERSLNGTSSSALLLLILAMYSVGETMANRTTASVTRAESKTRMYLRGEEQGCDE